MFNFVLQSSIRFHRYGRVLVSLLSNNYDHVIKKDAENFLLFCSWSLFFIPLFFNIFLAVVIFVLCVWVSVGFIRTAYVLLDSFFFFSSILCKAAHEVFVQHSSFTVFFFFFFSCILVWTECFNVLHFCYALCSRKCECVRECSCSSSCESPQNHTSRKSVAGADCDPTFWPSTWVYIVYIIIIYIL